MTSTASLLMPGRVYHPPGITLGKMPPLPEIPPGASPWYPALRLYQDDALSVYYAPMEYVTPAARVVLCGITPGATQARTALASAQQTLKSGGAVVCAQRRAKYDSVFTGAREAITAMLDAVGLNRYLGLASCRTLFGEHARLLHCTNVLRHPVVLAGGRGYNGTPAPHRHAYLAEMVNACLNEEIQALGESALWLPLGRAATSTLKRAREAGLLRPEQLLEGLPHPSGANRERILYFTGQKSRAALSRQTNPEMLDAARAALIRRINAG